MIPKKIHYCWFGEEPLPELAIKCLKSWRKFCPGYEIIEWNEENYSIKEKCAYVKEAYREKKWAFISDYARFDILYHYGGIYFDTDVELIKPIDDILSKGSFMGMEKDVVIVNNVIEKLTAASGLGLGSDAGNKIYREILDGYDRRHFVDEKGIMEQITVVTYVSEILSRHKPVILSDRIVQVEGIYIYPPEYFCPLDYETGVLSVTKNTRAIHHYMASWYTVKERKWLEIEQKIKRKFGSKIGNFICEMPLTRVYRILYRRGMKGTLKRLLRK